MATPEDINKSLNSANWPPELKQRLQAILPSCGPETLKSALSEVQAPGSEFVGKYLVPSLERAAAATQALHNGDAEPWLGLVQNALDERESDFGRYYIGPILDAKKTTIGKGLPKDLNLAWLKLEFAYYQELSENEYVEINSQCLLDALEAGDYLFILKKYFVERIYRKSPWPRQILQALLNNEERLGESPLLFEQKQAAPVVKNWIRDFTSDNNQSATAAGTFDEVRYLEHSANANKLGKGERQVLARIIGLYNWCSNPKTTREELGRQEQQTDSEKEAVGGNEKVFRSEQSSAAPKRVAPVVPAMPRLSTQPPASLKEVLSIRTPAAKTGSPPVERRPAVAPFSGNPVPAEHLSIQDILGKRERPAGGGLDLKSMGSSRTTAEVQKQALEVSLGKLNPPAPAPKTAPVRSEDAEKVSKQREIDRKLEELKGKAGKTFDN